jgi:hypothetical protein
VRGGTASDIGGNAVNPRVGSALQYTRTGREEEAGEVVQDHEVGTRMGSGFLIPKEARRRATGGRSPGVDSLAGDTTEGIFGQSQERKLGRPGRCRDDMGDHAKRPAYQPEFEPQDRIASG